MSIAVLTGHSKANAALARATLENKWNWTLRHNYDLIIGRDDWDAWKVAGLERLAVMLPYYEAVMTMGSDVVVMDQSKRIQDILIPGDHVVAAAEAQRPFNADVMIWRNTPTTSQVLWELIKRQNEWLGMKLLWQEFLWNCLANNPKLLNWLRIVPARDMNSTINPTSAHWQQGDFIVHFYGQPENIKLMAAHEWSQKSERDNRP